MCGQGSAPTEKHSRHRLVGVALDSTCFWFLGSFPDDKAPAGSWAGSGPTERILKVSDRSIPQYLQLYKAFFPSLRLPGRRSPPDITLRRFDRCGAATDADSIAMTPNLYPPSADPQSTHLLTTATAPPRRSCDARDRLARELSRRLDASLLSVGEGDFGWRKFSRRCGNGATCGGRWFRTQARSERPRHLHKFSAVLARQEWKC